MLHFNTSSYRYSGICRCDITYKSTDKVGQLFAPTKQLVHQYKFNSMSNEDYTNQYYQLMRQSYRQNKEKWLTIINSDEHYVFVCYCKANTFCHRYLLKDILIKLGAIYDGEIT